MLCMSCILSYAIKAPVMAPIALDITVDDTDESIAEKQKVHREFGQGQPITA